MTPAICGGGAGIIGAFACGWGGTAEVGLRGAAGAGIGGTTAVEGASITGYNGFPGAGFAVACAEPSAEMPVGEPGPAVPDLGLARYPAMIPAIGRTSNPANIRAVQFFRPERADMPRRRAATMPIRALLLRIASNRFLA